jgi:hypothetical protein
MAQNPLVDEQVAIATLTRLGEFINTLDEDIDLGYFFGVAYDVVNRDRNRFTTAIRYLLSTERNDPDNSRKKLIVCFDPNLERGNITNIFQNTRLIQETLPNTKLRSIRPVNFANEETQQVQEAVHAVNLLHQPPLPNNNGNQAFSPVEPVFEGANSPVQPFFEYQGGRLVMEVPRQQNILPIPLGAPPPLLVPIVHPPENAPYFYKLTFEKFYDDEVFTMVYYVYFMRYGLTSARTVLENASHLSSYIGKHKLNQLYIQGVRPDRVKTIDDYVNSCTYDVDTFYGHLETLGSHEKVKDLYVTSAMSSHDSFFVTNIEGNTYGSVVVRSGVAHLSATLSNRYFEDFCEILRVMRKIQEREKRVFYITLDSQFRVFNEISVPRTSNVPYAVPFVSTTKFFINDPKMYRHIEIPPPSAPRGTPIRVLDGGKRKKTRKHKHKAKKHKKTRKV